VRVKAKVPPNKSDMVRSNAEIFDAVERLKFVLLSYINNGPLNESPAGDAVIFKTVHSAKPNGLRVTVPVPELALNIAVSPTVGGEAPGAPPEVVDQLVVVTLSQSPVPPTQYLFAITYP